MARTWRDLGLPTRDEVWRDLRGMRALAPSRAAKSARRATFQTSLEQAQQFMEAAAGAGYATRALHLFYAISQGGRAIAAASERLPHTAEPPAGSNRAAKIVDWRLGGHGIKTSNTEAVHISETRIRFDGYGLPQGVALAIGVELPGAQGEFRLGDLWALLPEAHDVPLSAATIAALSFDGDLVRRRTSNGHDQATLNYVPRAVRDECGDDREKIREFLDHYPSLNGWAYPFSDGNPVGWSDSPERLYSGLPIYWKYPVEGTPEFDQLIAATKATAYRTPTDHWVFPKLGNMTTPMHPLLAWWTVLLALSILTRYEPSNWGRAINIDVSPEANAIEHILDIALDVLPAIILRGIHAAIET
ncbi:YaaC family protein [Jiangella alkaliphila]|uniref:YaaC-like Protein n=1 Tax=Jiangella alkaliphila TaxID=419479 RepID=A0A1H2H134_9ACTN|nr:hypothetical protein [Jiangella alkaliphila]SDU25560.1 hypothetical protein SAMN04488563_0784 [Jiangella alkaliphila]